MSELDDGALVAAADWLRHDVCDAILTRRKVQEGVLYKQFWIPVFLYM